MAQGAIRRGERAYEAPRQKGNFSDEHDLSHLFFGHTVEPDQSIEITSSGEPFLEGVRVHVVETSETGTGADVQESLFPDSSEDDISSSNRWRLRIDWPSHNSPMFELPINEFGIVQFNQARRFPRAHTEDAKPVRYISTAGLSVDAVVRMFENVVLTPEEAMVVEALSIIEPDIERLATVGTERRRGYPGERGGIVVKCRSSSQRVPIGSMGDGMWRMLGLALAMAAAEGGILLVDEIDTGLHYTVMDGMWKMLAEGARRFSTQVFATTHSRDCYESLATIAHEGVGKDGQVTIQRIEPERSRSVVFSEQEIIAAAERGMEVR